MTHNRFLNHCLIYALIVVAGLGLAFVVPLLANSQGLAASNEMGAKDNAPEATRYYVAKTGDGTTGLDWAKAFTNVQDALNTASSGDEIWVATGVYTPGINETDSFNLVPGTEVYGGFAATETLLTERDWETNVTVLSGDIGTAGNNADNSLHVIRNNDLDSTAILDGFIIQNGHAKQH